MSFRVRVGRVWPLNQIADSEMIPRLIGTRKSVMSIRKFSFPRASMSIAPNVKTYDNLESYLGIKPSIARASRCLDAAKNAGTNVVMVAMRKTIAVINS